MPYINQSSYTRIDIAGPAPFNTLVYCTFWGNQTLDPDGNLKRGRLGTLPSDYRIEKFEQVNPPPVFKHTTTGWIYATSLGDSDKDNDGPDAWLWAIDDIVDGGFDDNGNFYVEFDCAAMMPNQEHDPNYEPGGYVLFSYILVQEPQPTEIDPIDPPRVPGDPIPPRIPMGPHSGPKGQGHTEM
jgi:hypothetical protein